MRLACSLPHIKRAPGTKCSTPIQTKESRGRVEPSSAAGERALNLKVSGVWGSRGGQQPVFTLNSPVWCRLSLDGSGVTRSLTTQGFVQRKLAWCHGLAQYLEFWLQPSRCSAPCKPKVYSWTRSTRSWIHEMLRFACFAVLSISWVFFVCLFFCTL